VFSWFGTGIARLSQHWVGIIGLCLSAIATWYAVRASKASRSAELVRLAKLEAELCAECREGRRPPRCPLDMRAPHCPYRLENQTK
jgi:hypothetical protein